MLPLTRPRDREALPGEASLEPFPRGSYGAGSVPEEEPGPKRPRTAQAPGLLADAALQEYLHAGMALRRSVFASGHFPGPTAPRRSVARTIFPFDVRVWAAEVTGAPSDGGRRPRVHSGTGGASGGGRVVDTRSTLSPGKAPPRSKRQHSPHKMAAMRGQRRRSGGCGAVVPDVSDSPLHRTGSRLGVVRVLVPHMRAKNEGSYFLE